MREFLVGIKWKKYEQELEAENLNDRKRNKHPLKKLYCSIFAIYGHVQNRYRAFQWRI